MGLYSDPPTPQQLAEAQELEVLAYRQSRVDPSGRAVAIIAITLVLWPINLVVVTLRVYVRSCYLKSIKSWGWDDTLSVIGFVLFTASAVFAVLACYYGMGTLDAGLESNGHDKDALYVRAMEYFTYWQFLVLVSICIIKAAISMALMRFTIQRRFRIPLWIVTISTAIIATGSLLSLAIVCKPLSATWNINLGQCLPYGIVTMLSYVLSAIAIPTDFMCAIIPYLLFRNLQMEAKTKWALIGVMGLGIVAGFATIVRVPYLHYYTSTEQKLYNISHLMIWTMVETGLGIFAGCLPPLGKLFIAKFGAFRPEHPSRQQRAGAEATIGGTPLSLGTPLETFTPARSGRTSAFASSSGGKWNRLDDETSSGQGIRQEKTVHVESRRKSDDGDSILDVMRRGDTPEIGVAI